MNIMGGLNGPAYLSEHRETFFQIQPVLVAIFVKRPPDYELHHEIGKAVVGRSASKKVRDVRMVERCGYLSLATKSLQDHVRIHPALDEFDGDGLVELSVDTRSTVYDTHAAAPDLFIEAIRTDPAADHGIGRDVLKLLH